MRLFSISEICSPTDYVPIATAVKVLLPFFKTKLSICFSSRKASQRDSSMAAFLPGFASLKQALMADFSKIFQPFKFLTIGRVFFHCCHKMKYSCYQESSFIPSWIVYLFFC